MPASPQPDNASRRLAACLLLMAPLLASAQPIYRITGPDGRVTFSDKPPADARASALPAREAASSPAAASGLPYELQQVARRYPVTLFTTDNCAPCQSARTLLQGRGIPYSERTVTTPQDGEALKKLIGDTGLPVLTLGAQQLKGFSAAEWQQYLTAAGYPQQPQLPAGYRPPPPTPLAETEKPGAPPPAPLDNIPPPPAAPAIGPANPAGIVF